MRRDERRAVAAAQARAIADDPADLAEIRAIQDDIAALHERSGVPAAGMDHEQRGRRYAVVLQPDWLSLSTWIVAFTSMSARPTSFRPTVIVADNETLVMCGQLATVDLNRLTEQAGLLTMDELQRVDQAPSLVLDL